MARPSRVTVSSQTASAPIPLDHYNTPFSVGLGCDVSAGATLTYTVEHTFDDVHAATFNPATATWFANASLTAQTGDKDGNYAYPVMAVRINVTAYTSGSVTFTVIQAGGAP